MSYLLWNLRLEFYEDLVRLHRVILSSNSVSGVWEIGCVFRRSDSVQIAIFVSSDGTFGHFLISRLIQIIRPIKSILVITRLDVNLLGLLLRSGSLLPDGLVSSFLLTSPCVRNCSLYLSQVATLLVRFVHLIWLVPLHWKSVHNFWRFFLLPKRVHLYWLQVFLEVFLLPRDLGN